MSKTETNPTRLLPAPAGGTLARLSAYRADGFRHTQYDCALFVLTLWRFETYKIVLSLF